MSIHTRNATNVEKVTIETNALYETNDRVKLCQPNCNCSAQSSVYVSHAGVDVVYAVVAILRINA